MHARPGKVTAPKKTPIYTATKSLDVKYTFSQKDGEKSSATVSGANPHAYLFAGYEGLIETRDGMTTKNGYDVYTSSIDQVNIALAMVTILYTDTQTKEGYRSDEIQQKSYFVRVNSKRNTILSSHDFYTEEKLQPGVSPTKAGRDEQFNTQLMQRVSAFSNVSALYSYPPVMIASSAALQKAIDGEMFHETFHHSEQALMHYMGSDAGIKDVVNIVAHTGAAYMYGMTLDIFTQRMLCVNCNGSIIGMQNSEPSGFLHDFNYALTCRDIENSDAGIMLDVRVSAKQAAKTSPSMDALKLPNDAGIVHEYNGDKDIARVLQAENKSLGTLKIINDKKLDFSSCKSTFFVSSTFSKEKLEDNIRDIRMIATPRKSAR